MAHDWIADKRTYESDGHLVPRAEVRREVENLIEQVSREAADLADKYESGAINIGEFETAMRALLKAGHVTAASVGRGGIAQMEAADWGKVASKIKWQYQYLEKFARKLTTGKLDKAYSAHRARSYASSLYISYSNGRAAAEQEFIDNGGTRSADNKNPQCMLVQNSAEGCEECDADASIGWMDVDEMEPIGSRLCGDWCKCEILFEDETDEA